MRHFVRSFSLPAILGAVVLSFASCSPAVEYCSGTTSEGNLGLGVNTPYDEYAPVPYGLTQMLFTSNRHGGRAMEFVDSLSKFGEDIYTSEVTAAGFSEAEIVRNPPLNSFLNDGSAAFYFDGSSGRVEMYFASFSAAGAEADADLFVCVHNEDGWSMPEPLGRTVNSPYWDAQPVISADGLLLIFASDRPLNADDVDAAARDADLYIATRPALGQPWSTPRNLGDAVNTEFDEITPALAPDNALYFASNAHSSNRSFDLLVSRPGITGAYGRPQALPFPLNTQFDENSPALWRDSIIFASNRLGGCGGCDLYAMRLCQDVMIQGRVDSDFHSPGSEAVDVYNAADERIASLPLDEFGRFEMPVDPGADYRLAYSNPCYRGDPLEQNISAPCAFEPVVLRVEFSVPTFDLPQTALPSYSVPFFVTGYYKPSTSDNLQDLRSRFLFNLIGKDDSTTYIELPGERYDGYAPSVEQALVDMADVLKDFMAIFLDECATGREVLEITVEGFADPRPISESARYADESISDPDLNVYVQRGDRMSNKVLSRLRAYFTARELQRLLAVDSIYPQYEERVRFRITNRVVAADSDDETYAQQRRIKVSARIIQ